MGQRHPPWNSQVVEGVADVLGDTSTGLTSTQIGQLLADLKIPDPLAGDTKRVRLRYALLAQQQKDRASNCVIAFITRSMAPVRYRFTPGLRTLRQDALNEVLVYEGVGRFARADGHGVGRSARCVGRSAC